MTPTQLPGLLGSDTVLAKRYDTALLDLDGVVYLGSRAVDGAPGALAEARALGMRLAFVTNNAARPPGVVADHLTELGIPASAGEVTTSAQAAAHYLAERLPEGARVLVVGTAGLVEALAERGLSPVDRDDETVRAVAQGFSPDLTWKQLAQGALAINRGAVWVATNLDPTVPSPLGRLPGNGSLVAALRHATGAEPVATGKPDPTMHRESVERSGAMRPIVVGDRLDTDIEGANAAGCASLLVFSGVTDPVDVITAPVQLRPSYLAADVGGLLVAHPCPVPAEDAIACGAWTARAELGGALTLSRGVAARADADGSSDGASELDALRALCVASWRSNGVNDFVAADDEAKRVLSALGIG